MNTNASQYDQMSFEDHVKLEFHDEFRRKKGRFLKRFLPNKGKLLDVGCGSGFDLRFLTQGHTESVARGGTVVGVDISMNMLQQSRRYLSSNGLRAYLVRADARALPFRDDVFGLAHSHELSVFNYGSVDERVDVLREQRRVCKLGGTIVTVLPQRDQEGFLPTGEPQMRYLFRSAGIKFTKPVYYMGTVPKWSTPGILSFLHRVLPASISKRFIKTPDEYLRTGHFVMGLGIKVK